MRLIITLILIHDEPKKYATAALHAAKKRRAEQFALHQMTALIETASAGQSPEVQAVRKRILSSLGTANALPLEVDENLSPDSDSVSVDSSFIVVPPRRYF